MRLCTVRTHAHSADALFRLSASDMDTLNRWALTKHRTTPTHYIETAYKLTEFSRRDSLDAPDLRAQTHAYSTQVIAVHRIHLTHRQNSFVASAFERLQRGIAVRDLFASTKKSFRRTIVVLHFTPSVMTS